MEAVLWKFDKLTGCTPSLLDLRDSTFYRFDVHHNRCKTNIISILDTGTVTATQVEKKIGKKKPKKKQNHV